MPVLGYEGAYEVSSIGRVRSVDRTHLTSNQGGPFVRGRKGRDKVPFFDARGRARVALYRNGKSRGWSVCHLVLLAFDGPPPGAIGLHDYEYSCNHKDGDATNNFVGNLEWLLNTAHRAHTVANRLNARRERHNMTKLNWALVREMRARHATGDSYSTLASSFGVSKSNVAQIINHQTWNEDEGF